MLNPKTLLRFREIAECFSLDESQQAKLVTAMRDVWNDSTSRPSIQSWQVLNDSLNHAQSTLIVEEGRTPLALERRSSSFGDMPLLPMHLEDTGLITVGGMGEIRRVFDKRLRRHLILKILRADFRRDIAAAARFVEEAQITAQLEHPGIVPVHELGRLQDGRPYFTMREICGRTLEDVMVAVHRASSPHGWSTSPCGWSRRKLLTAFHKVCETVTYAHRRGVIHRDLKPANILVGEFGEVLVVDWGLAKVLGEHSTTPTQTPELITDRSESGSHSTQVGTVAGTLAYMPPEQAKGNLEDLDPTADVYALGAILYELLCGQPPYEGSDWKSVWNKVVNEPPPSLLGTRQWKAPPIPEELAETCARAMNRDPRKRFSNAGPLTDQINAFVDGERRQLRARQTAERATQLLPRIEALRENACSLRSEADSRLRPLPSYASIREKRSAWEMQDRADALDREASLEEAQFLQLIQGALNQDPDLMQARSTLAAYYRKQHEEAEYNHRHAECERLHAMLVAQNAPEQVAYLAGTGHLSLTTQPAATQVSLYAFKPRDRRLEAVFIRSLGPSPILRKELPIGSYMLRIQQENHCTVDYPVHIERGRHWDNVNPHTGHACHVALPPEGSLGPEDRYIAPGWFIADGDPYISNAIHRRRVWLDGFVIRRHPVTNREFLAFLNHLVAHGQSERASELEPREWVGDTQKMGAAIYHRNPDGHYLLGKDKDGHLWLPDWPVVLIDAEAAHAYAEWIAQQSRIPWRLPTEYEWEKAARGVDGRLYPWGHFFDPTWANTRESKPKPMLDPVHQQKLDVSPYDVWGTAGNVMEWTSSPDDNGRLPQIVDGKIVPPQDDSSTRNIIRGGAWSLFKASSRLTHREGIPRTQRMHLLSFRLAYTFNPPGGG